MTTSKNDEHDKTTETLSLEQQKKFLTSSDSHVIFRTRIRIAITPYLPPPVVAGIRNLDHRVEHFLGQEGSITIVGSLLMSWLLYQVFRALASGVGSGAGRAVKDDDQDHDVLEAANAASTRPFVGSIMLCGPSMAGKTSLFYHLLNECNGNDNHQNGQLNLHTVKSIKINTGFLGFGSSSLSGNSAITTTWRLIDTPGSWGPQKLLQGVPLSQIQRIVIVIDSTQPITAAVDYVYALLYPGVSVSTDKPKLLIACHKSKHPKAKNTRRIKLQLRSELNRLQELKGLTGDGTNAIANIDWDTVLNETPLCPSNVGDEGEMLLEDLQMFCENGTILSNTYK